MLDSVFETFICFMTSQNCLKCQGQAIKIIVKNNDNKQKFNVCVHVFTFNTQRSKQNMGYFSHSINLPQSITIVQQITLIILLTCLFANKISGNFMNYTFWVWEPYKIWCVCVRIRCCLCARSVKSLFMTPLYRYLCSIKGTLKFHYGLHNHKDSIKPNCFDYIAMQFKQLLNSIDRSSFVRSLAHSVRRLLTFGGWLPLLLL